MLVAKAKMGLAVLTVVSLPAYSTYVIENHHHRHSHVWVQPDPDASPHIRLVALIRPTTRKPALADGDSAADMPWWDLGDASQPPRGRHIRTRPAPPAKRRRKCLRCKDMKELAELNVSQLCEPCTGKIAAILGYP
jgi:hypothetical protein